MNPIQKLKGMAGDMHTSIANSLMRQKLADKFEFKKILSFKFEANRKKDLIIISAWGITDTNPTPHELKSDPLKLSENQEMENGALAKAGDYIPMNLVKEIHTLSSVITFPDSQIIEGKKIKIDGKIEGKIEYLNFEDKPKMRKFDGVFK